MVICIAQDRLWSTTVWPAFGAFEELYPVVAPIRLEAELRSCKVGIG